MNRNNIRLFVFDENQQSTCYERCKIKIDKIIKELIIVPSKNEDDREMVVLNFDRTFVYRENILCTIDSSSDSNNYLLILKSTNTCKAIFDIIQKGKTIKINDGEQLDDRKHMSKFEELLQLIDIERLSQNVAAEIEDNTVNMSNPQAAINSFSRKRKQCQQQQLLLPFTNKIIEALNFKIIAAELTQNGIKRLLIFPNSNDTSKCYEYSWCKFNKLYKCLGCQVLHRGVSARVFKHAKNGKEYVRLLSTKHVCQPRKYDPEKFECDPSKKITSGFKVIRNELDDVATSKLIIFSSSDGQNQCESTSKCYEYTWNTGMKLYNCMGCKRLKKTISAKILKDTNGKDYVKLHTTKHVCQMRDYNPEKFVYDPAKRIIESENYQVIDYRHKGKAKSVIILYCSSNKNLCYEYFWHNSSQNYACGGCYTLKQSTSAIVCKKENGDEYLKLNKAAHICDLREVDLTKFTDDLVLQKPNYEIIERYFCGIKKKFLLIFTTPEKEKCYKFGYASSDKCFYCLKCGSSRGISIKAFVKNKNGEEIVYVRNKQHKCSPLEYSAVTRNNVVEASKYQLIKRKIFNKIVQRLVVFIDDEKVNCYEYTWSQATHQYICNPCHGRYKVHVFAKIYKNEQNIEYLELCKNQHKCSPIKFAPETEAKRVYEPNFKIEEYTAGGIQRQRIIMFDEKDKNMGYFYYKETGRDSYKCCACHAKRKYVTVKLLIESSSGKSYIELSEFEHVCEPQQLKGTTLTTIRKPNFKLEECTIDGFKRKFVVIFTSSDPTLCYKYCYNGTDKAYLCVNCKKLSPESLVAARLHKDKSGEEYISLNKNQHLCQPAKCNPEEFSTKIVTSPFFKLETTVKNDAEKKKLFVRSATFKDKWFEYCYVQKDDKYICKNCNDKNIDAKLCQDENGEDYLRMGFKNHNKQKCRAVTIP